MKPEDIVYRHADGSEMKLEDVMYYQAHCKALLLEEPRMDSFNRFRIIGGGGLCYHFSCSCGSDGFYSFFKRFLGQKGYIGKSDGVLSDDRLTVLMFIAELSAQELFEIVHSPYCEE